MIRENEHISNNHILIPPRRPHDRLRDILARQRRHALVHRVRLLLVPAEPHNAELRLHLPGIDLDDADPRRDELFAHGVREAADGGLRRAVDASARVGFAAGDGADIDDVARARFAFLLHDLQAGLRHVDQAEHVGVELDRDVFLFDVSCFVHALDQPGVVDEDVDVFEFLWQGGDEVLHFL